MQGEVTPSLFEIVFEIASLREELGVVEVASPEAGS